MTELGNKNQLLNTCDIGDSPDPLINAFIAFSINDIYKIARTSENSTKILVYQVLMKVRKPCCLAVLDIGVGEELFSFSSVLYLFFNFQ